MKTIVTRPIKSFVQHLTKLFFLTAVLLAPPGYSEEGAEAAPTDADAAASSDMSSTMKPAPLTPDQLEQQQQADIATAQTPETEVFWLDAGEQKRLALYLPSVAPEAHAGIIIFPDTSTSADWPDFIHPLRTDLTEHGWSTLTLNPPPEPAAAIPERTLPSRLDSSALQAASNTGQPATETDPQSTATTEDATAEAADSPEKNNTTASPETTTETATDKPVYSDLMNELGTAARQILTEKGHEQLVVMGVGNGAVWATRFFMTGDSEEGYLVLVDPRDSSMPETPSLVTLIRELKAPVLDLWLETSQQSKQDAALRKRVAQRNKETRYTQIRINRRTDATGKHPQWLTKQVRGILNSRIMKSMQSAPVKAAPDSQIPPGA